MDGAERSGLDRMVDGIAAAGQAGAAVLEAMRRVDREEFVPDRVRRLAYEDRALPIGEEQTISQPSLVALMLEVLELEPGARVLDVGTGSGYQAALLAALGCRVVSIELNPRLAADARRRLSRLAPGVIVLTGDATEALDDDLGFDTIVVAAAASAAPAPLLELLRDGGRMLIPLRQPDGADTLTLFTRRGDHAHVRSLLRCSFVPLVGGSSSPGTA